MKKVSVIIPVYKVEKYLDRCVESVVNQTYQNLEIILVDDGSPDNCPQLCDEWAKKDKRIKVVHKENGGVASARNLGLEKATGDFIAFVDSDDWIDLSMYEELLNTANQTNADIVFSKFRYVYANGKREEIRENKLETLRNKELFYLFVFGNDDSVHGGPCRMIVKRNIAQTFKFTTKLKHGEDLFYVLDCIEKAEKIEVIEKTFYNYYVNDVSVTRDIGEQYFKNIKDLYDYQNNYLKEKHLEWKYLINHGYLYRNVTKRMQRKDFVKQMKELEKNDEYFKACFNKENYKKIQKIEVGLKNKFRNFIVYHKMWRIVKFLSKIS